MVKSTEQLLSEGWSAEWIAALITLRHRYPDYELDLSYEGMDGLCYIRGVLKTDESVELEVGRVEVDNPEYPDYDYSDVTEWKDGHMYISKITERDGATKIEQLEVV